MDEQRLTTVLVEFARTLTADFSIQTILDHLAARVAVRDLAQDTRFTRFSPAAAQAGLGAVYSFPLSLDDRQLGALELYAKEPVDLSNADLVGAQILADVTAAYLFNAQAREAARDLARTSAELAATLQESLLPPALPEVPGFTVAARFLSGRGGTLVGGDFYDIFPLPARRWGVLVGDVVGHGARRRHAGRPGPLHGAYARAAALLPAPRAGRAE